MKIAVALLIFAVVDLVGLVIYDWWQTKKEAKQKQEEGRKTMAEMDSWIDNANNWYADE